MQLDEFRERVRRTFGEDLHRASPASVREFLDQLQFEESIDLRNPHRFVIDETAKTYEEVMRTFFTRVLDMPCEDAVRHLWLIAFDLAYVAIASSDAERLDRLFGGMEDPAL
jgi:hypothetical protein